MLALLPGDTVMAAPASVPPAIRSHLCAHRKPAPRVGTGLCYLLPVLCPRCWSHSECLDPGPVGCEASRTRCGGPGSGVAWGGFQHVSPSSSFTAHQEAQARHVCCASSARLPGFGLRCGLWGQHMQVCAAPAQVEQASTGPVPLDLAGLLGSGVLQIGVLGYDGATGLAGPAPCRAALGRGEDVEETAVRQP